MKIRIPSIVLIAAGFAALPALACGPGMTQQGNHKQRGQSPGRAKWTQNRLRELDAERKNLKHSGPGTFTKAKSKMQQFNNPLAYTDADRARDLRKRAQIKNAIEYLSLLQERGQLNPQGQAKLRALINYYRTNYMSGY